METIEIFNEDNSCKIRSAFIEGKGLIFSIYDFINLACERDMKCDYGKDTFKRIQLGHDCPDCQKHQFPGERQRPTPVSDIRGLQQILMLLIYIS
jgi:hypothetical protein